MRYSCVGILSAVLAISFACAGCAANRDTAITNPAAVRAAKPKTAPIQVLIGDDKPSRPFVQVAVMQVAGDMNDFKENIEELQDKARSLGADAVIVRNLTTVADQGPFRTTYQTTKEGTIIIWK